MSLPSRRLLAGCAALAWISSSPLARGEFSDFRALFVNRFEYAQSSASINAIMQNAANLGITDVMFQVRGRADAFYDSNFEPRGSGVPAGFDPLQTAIAAAHSRGLKIHAWMNTMPLWNSLTLPSSPTHPFYHDDPSFRIEYLDGTLEPPNGSGGGYSIVNPILPQVHDHINNVVNDVASNYDVDGIHLDYVRYVSGSNFSKLPHDDVSHAMFNAVTGLDASKSSNAAAYKNYIEQRITDLVRTLGSTVEAAETAAGRTIEYSASVWRDPDVGEADYMQDYRTWLEQDLLDIVMPMIYLSSSNDHLFNPNLLNSLNAPSNSRVVPTIGTYLHTANAGGPELTVSQLQRANSLGADGAAFYGYSALFADPLAADRREAIKTYYDSLIPTPGLPGDFSADGTVDGSDLAVWTEHFGAPSGAQAEEGDADGDGDVDGTDFLIWQRSFGVGSTANIVSATTVVPEPNDLALLAIGGGLLRRFRRG